MWPAPMLSTIANGKKGRLQGKAAIITGAARGIGRATAIAFARAGADVMGIDIAAPVSETLDVAPATADELAETGSILEVAQNDPGVREKIRQRIRAPTK